MGKSLVIDGIDASAVGLGSVSFSGGTVGSLYGSAKGITMLLYTGNWRIFSNNNTGNFQIWGCKLNGVDGMTIRVSLAQPYADGAFYCFFTNSPIDVIDSISELSGYSPASSPVNLTQSKIVESFNLSTVTETETTADKVVPTGAKYLFFANAWTAKATPTVTLLE